MTTLLMTVFGSSPAWADDATFSFSTKWGGNSQTVDNITVTFGGTTSDQTGFRRFKKSATMAVSAESGYNITSVAITFSTDNSKSIPTTEQITANPTGDSYAVSGSTLTWTGSTSSITFTKDDTGNEFDITGITVTYTSAASGDVTQVINIADLRFEHLTYNPGRSGVAGFDITTSGWMTYTTVLEMTGHTLSCLAAQEAIIQLPLLQIVLTAAGRLNRSSSMAAVELPLLTMPQ